MIGDVLIGVQHGRDWMDWANLLATVSGVVVVGVYTFLTLKQLKRTGEAVKTAQESNQLAAKALELNEAALTQANADSTEALAETRRSNEATEESNRIAKEGLELATRAWLVLDFKLGLDRGNFIGYRIEVTNVGKVPATEVELWYSFDKWEGVSEIPDPIKPANLRRLEHGIVIGSNVTHTSIPDEESYAFMDARRDPPLTTFYCSVTYLDYFGQPRATVACWRYRPEVTLADQRDWVLASKHNSLR
jgi:hypothetical protein